MVLARRLARINITVVVYLLFLASSTAFAPLSYHNPKPFHPYRRTITKSPPSPCTLFGISEWRSKNLESASHPSNSNNNRTLLLLPFAMEGALLVPGQSQTIVFKEGRFFDLLDEATTEEHCHVIGTIIMGEDSLLDVFPLCEVTAFSLDAEYRGKLTATVTLKSVGRAHLTQVQQLKPFMRGIASEVVDNHSNLNLEACREIVEDVEHMILATSSSQNAIYQQHFWQALTALGYSPTALLTSDPFSTNCQKEVEAASWAALSLLTDPEQKYQAMACTDVLERLQRARRALLDESFQRSSQQTVVLSSSANSDDNSTSSSSFYEQAGFE